MNVKKIRLFLFFSFFFIHFSFAQAYDFGMFLNRNVGFGGQGGDKNFDYSISAIPWITGLLGETGDLIVTAGFELDYNGGFGFAHELLRTEAAFRPGNWAFEIGRMYHSDPLGLVAEGLFDGVKAAYYSEAGTFSAGAWYTGLLYKKRTVIEMTVKEYEANRVPLDFDDLAGTYFAPRRFLGALGWEHFGWSVQASASVLGQFEFFTEEPLNSQYVVLKLILPVKIFSFDLGGCLELIENEGKTKMAFAAEAGFAITPKTVFKNRLSFLARYSSGESSRLAAFLPLTTEGQGNILAAKLSGLSVISMDYAALVHPALSAGLTSMFFIRNGLTTYNGYRLQEAESSWAFLGNEVLARLLWSPATDLQVNLGGGWLFMPSLRNTAPNSGYLWRVELNMVFSLF
jgi:hypothetical protein